MYFQKTSFVRALAPIVLAYDCFISPCSIVCLCAHTEPVAVPVLEHPHARASPTVAVPSVVSVCAVQTQLSTSPPPDSCHQSWSWWRCHLVNTFGGHFTFSHIELHSV